MASPEFGYNPDAPRNAGPIPEPLESGSPHMNGVMQAESAVSTGSVESVTRSHGHTTPPHKWRHLEDLVRIGKGFFSEVYRAWDVRLEQEVALKLYRQTEGEQDWSRLGLREARFLARIRHPNVV